MAIFQPQIVGKGGSNQDIQYDVMPEATIENLGRVIQYVGDTIPSTEASAIATQTVGSGLTDLAVDVEKFEEAEKPIDDCTVDFVCTDNTVEHLDPETIVEASLYTIHIDSAQFLSRVRESYPNFDNFGITIFRISHSANNQFIDVTGYRDGSEVFSFGDIPSLFGITFDGTWMPYTFSWETNYVKNGINWGKDGESVNLEDYGVSYNGTPTVDDTISVIYTPATSGYYKGYFYENQAKYSDPSATISQTAGQIDSISFETISGNTTISGTTQAVINWYTNIGLSQYPSSGTINITYRDDMDRWSFTSSGGANSTVSQDYFEVLGFVFTGVPQAGDHIICTYSLGSISNLSIDIEKFIETEQPTEDETVDFVSSGAQYSITPTHWNNYGLDITIDDANLFINQILERRPDVSITKEGNNIQGFYFCCIYNEQQINRIVIRANSYQTEYDVDSSWGVTINGDQSDDPNTWRNYPINTVSVKDGWVKNDEAINISDYGISYEGLPVEGDTLTVEYVDSKVIGYNWVQKDVQDQPEIPEVGIDWKTKVDVPADYPQGYAWSCAPIYTVPGGLPDGKYEVYWQILCPKAYNDENIPFGKVTYKAEFGIYTSGSSRRTYGRVSYVMNGEWLENGDYMPNDNNYWNIFRQNGEDLIFFSTDQIFRTTILGNRPNSFVPECFKLSAFKNLDTGEEYIATGDLYMGINPSYTKMISGSWSTRKFANEPFVPNYRSGSSGQYNNSQQYIYLQPENCIGNKIQNYVVCAGIDFAMKANNGDEYHVIVENSIGGSSIAKVQKATGNLANTQIGYDQNGYAYVYLNTPSGTSDQVEFYLSLIGAEQYTANCWIIGGSISNFTPIAETRVGSAIDNNNIGRIEQYTGETTAEYTNGYFYKATGTEVFIPEGATCECYTGQYTQPTITDFNTFVSTMCNYWGWTRQDLINNLNRNHHWEVHNNDGTISVYYSALGWMYGETAQTLYSCMSFNPIIETGNWTGFWIIYTPEHREYIDTYWEQVNVQPGSGSHEPIEPGTHTKITYNSDGLVTAGGELNQSDIPVLPLEKISGVVASAAEVNKLHGLNTTTTELNYVNGVTSNIQNQLTNKVIFRNWN